MSETPQNGLPPTETPTLDAEHPWPGLQSFGEEDRQYFRGREAETADLLRLVMRERLTLAFGRSGLGKTSLLRAGLFPRCREQRLLPIYIRLNFADGSPDPRRQILDAIAWQASAVLVECPRAVSSETLWEYFHRKDAGFWNRRNRPVIPLLVLDQFEEIFTVGRGRKPETDAIVSELAELAEGRPPKEVRTRLNDAPEEARRFSFGRHAYKILVCLREDFLPQLEGLRGEMRGILDNRYRLRRMDGQNALAVVSLGNLVKRDDPDVAIEIVRFVAASEDHRLEAPLGDLEVEPALLSVVCRELNERRLEREAALITSDLLEGNRDEILETFYERSLVDLGPGVRTFVEERLLTKSGHRDSVAMENALDEAGVTAENLQQLIDRRLLRIEDHAGVQRVELTHDLLTPVIGASRDRRRQREARAEAEAALREEVARAALEAQEAAEAKYQKRKLRLALSSAATLGVLLLVAVLLAFYASSQKKTAIEEKRRSVAQTKTIAALLALEVDPSHSLRLAREAVEATFLADGFATAEAENALHQALESARAKLVWICPEDLELGEGGALSSDGRHLALVSRDGSVIVWEATAGATGLSISGIGTVYDLALSAGGQTLATVGDDESVRVWDVASEREIRRLESRGGPIGQIRFSPGGETLTVADDQSARLMDWRSGKIQFEIPAGPDDFVKIFFSPDGSLIATTDGKGGLKIRRAATGAEIRTILDTDRPVTGAVSFSPDGSRIATASEAEAIFLWQAEEGRWLKNLIGREVAQTTAFSPGGRFLTSIDFESAHLWDLHSGKNVFSLVARPASPGALSADGRRLLTSTETGAAVWELAFDAMPVLPHPEAVRSAQFDRDGTHLASLGTDGSIRLWDVGTRRIQSQIPSGESDGRTLAFHPDGVRAVVADRSGGVSLWNLATGQRIYRLQGLRDRVTAVKLAAGGAWIATGGAEGEIGLWSTDTGDLVRRLPGHGAGIRSMAATGGRLATAGGDGSVKLWDAVSGELLESYTEHEGAVDSLAFDPTGGRLAAGGEDGKVRIWEPGSNRPPLVLTGHEAGIQAVAFSPDGETLASGGLDQRVIITKVSTQETVLDLKGQTDVVTGLAFGPNGKMLASSGRDRVVRLHLLDIGELLELAKSRQGIDNAG